MLVFDTGECKEWTEELLHHNRALQELRNKSFEQKKGILAVKKIRLELGVLSNFLPALAVLSTTRTPRWQGIHAIGYKLDLLLGVFHNIQKTGTNFAKVLGHKKFFAQYDGPE